MDVEKRRLVSGEWLRRLVSSSALDSTGTTEAYFDSFEACYPLLASAGDMLMEEARANGIETENRSPEEIARELFTTAFVRPDVR